MVIKSQVEIENLCSCREAREWGKICEHGVAVGLHWLEGQKGCDAAKAAASAAKAAAPIVKRSVLRRDAAGEPAALCVILPPNFEQAAARGKVMLALEAGWSAGRCPLNALPRDRAFAFAASDEAIIDKLEILAARGDARHVANGGEGFCGRCCRRWRGTRMSRWAKQPPVTVATSPVKLPLRATLEAGGEIVLALAEKAEPVVMVGGLGLAEAGFAAARFAGGG